MFKVSIIIPTYNVEVYLRECLDSMVRQTLKDIEIICVNDGSTDSSLEIIQEYAKNDKRIVIIDKENGGYGMAMNIGIDKANGEYIGIVEPDDFVPLNMFEDLYNIAISNKVDFVKADFYRFKRDTVTGNMELLYNKLDRLGTHYNRVIIPQEEPECATFILNTWSGIYNRKFLFEHNIRHNETPGASYQDNGFFWQTLMYAKKVMYVNKPYYMNRRDNPNSSVFDPNKVYCVNIEYDFIRDIFAKKENKKIWEIYKHYFSLKRFYAYISTIDRISDCYKKEYVRCISSEFERILDFGEIDVDRLSKPEKDKIMLLVNDYEGFYYKYALKVDKTKADYVLKNEKEKNDSKRIKELEQKIFDIRNSETFKVGKFILYFPQKIKKLLNRK